MTPTTMCQDGSEANRLLEYRRLPLDELVRRIERDADRAALREFHGHRPLFRIRRHPPLLFVQFVEAVLRNQAGEIHGEQAADLRKRAYDLTIDKFLRFPVDAAGDGVEGQKPRGIDCRHYFGMLSRSIETWKNANVDASVLAIETVAARLIQRHVARHCRLSLLEAARSPRSARSRYDWQLPTGLISIWMPTWLNGTNRRVWLETNVPTPDASRPGQRERVQAIVNAHWGAPRFLSFDECVHAVDFDPEPAIEPEFIVAEQMSVRGLAAFVADEKTLRMAEQRPALRRLGEAGLRALIQRIFDDLSSGCLEDQVVARAFGLSKATFSRFAGRRRRSDGARLADLWLNLARSLCCYPPFVIAAKEAGIQEIVRCIIATQGGKKQ